LLFSSYYLGVFGKFARQTPKKQQLKRFRYLLLSAPKMKKKINFIPMLAEQNYPNFEIVLIDDASSDSTLDILRNLKTISNIRLVKVRMKHFGAIRNTR
jgi:cellulose synthase/poly-beta-1,6-N-acetylglucosamine synthase-like glycosyltransferase